MRTIATSLYEDCVVEGCEMLTAGDIMHDESGMRFTLRWQNENHEVRTQVFGRFNVSNLREPL